VEWKPTGASALAALANEELASRAPSPAVHPAAARSVMEQLPDSGGVDPTGAIPLPIKAMERTGERPVHRSSVARGAEELRHKRTMRTVVIGAVLTVVAVAGGAFAWVQFAMKPAAPVAQVAPPPIPAPAPAAPAPAPAPAAEVATNTLAAAPVVATPPPAAPPAPEKPAEAAAPRKAKAPPPVAARPARPPVAQAAPAAPRPAEKPAAEKPAPKKKDGLLDFDQGGDDDLAAALGSGAGGRKVYVPPAAGTATAAPDRLTEGQINESVSLHLDGLKRCLAEQRTRAADAHGTMKVSWIIQADGTPREVRCITPEYAATPFAQCITAEVKGMRFPRLGDARGQQVTFPFSF
jgi:outer membrane biosynthesis protein TonB